MEQIVVQKTRWAADRKDVRRVDLPDEEKGRNDPAVVIAAVRSSKDAGLSKRGRVEALRSEVGDGNVLLYADLRSGKEPKLEELFAAFTLGANDVTLKGVVHGRGGALWNVKDAPAPSLSSVREGPVAVASFSASREALESLARVFWESPESWSPSSPAPS